MGLAIKPSVFAAYFVPEVKTLYLMHPDGTNIGLSKSDNDINVELAVNEWISLWMLEINNSDKI